MSNFIEIEVEIDPIALKEEVYEAIRTQWPDWEPAEGNLETWLVEGFSNQSLDIGELAAEVPTEIFKEFGESVLGVEAIDAKPAIGAVDWTMIDNAGYTVNAGTLIGISTSGSETVAFKVIDEFTVPNGSTTATNIAIEALIPGVEANGVSGNVEPLDALDFVDTIEISDEPSGGIDAETDDQYLDRLAAELRLLTPRPILPVDFATLARKIGGVSRTLAIDLYDPGTDTYDNERTVTVALTDAAGLPVSGPVADAVEAYLESMREVNFVVHVMDPNYTVVDTEITVTRFSGFDSAAVATNVESAVAEFFDPSRWGLAEDTPFNWREITTVRLNDLIALIDGISGVDYVTTVKMQEQGVGSMAAANLTLDGPASLTVSGNHSITVEAP